MIFHSIDDTKIKIIMAEIHKIKLSPKSYVNT